jgi:hypothetical protein
MHISVDAPPDDRSVVLCARARDHSVLTIDVADLRRLDPSLRLVAI